MEKATLGKAGAVRVSTMDSHQLAGMEKHGKREDQTSLHRKINDDSPLVFGGLDLVELQAKHVEGSKQQGKTKGLHALVQFPSGLVPNDEKAQKAMLNHAVKFINKAYGGDAVFAARLDRDEKGTHKVDVFFLPRWQHRYKSGKTQQRCGIGTYAKKNAEARYVKEKTVSTKTGKPINLVSLREAGDKRQAANDKHTQGAALQDSLYEYLRDYIPNIVRGERKASSKPDRLEPEVFGLKKDRERHALKQMRTEKELADRAETVLLAEKAAEDKEKRAQAILDEALAKEAKVAKDAAVLSVVREKMVLPPDKEIDKIAADGKARRRAKTVSDIERS